MHAVVASSILQQNMTQARSMQTAMHAAVASFILQDTGAADEVRPAQLMQRTLHAAVASFVLQRNTAQAQRMQRILHQHTASVIMQEQMPPACVVRTAHAENPACNPLPQLGKLHPDERP
jgi:hypothetical protein